MTRYSKRAIQWPLHLFLLPIYFIVNKTVHFRGLLNSRSVLLAFILVTIGVALLFGLFYLIYRNPLKSALATTLSTTIYLFFGDIKQAFSELPVLHYLSHYKILIPLLLLLWIIFILYLRKKNNPLRLTTYFNLVLVIYFIVEGVTYYQQEKSSKSLVFSNSSIVQGKTQSMPADRPNIIYFIIDGYPSPQLQKEELGIEEAALDSILDAKGFKTISNSRSNYSNTAFSMASVFNMDYIKGVDTSSQLAPYHYNRCMELVKNSPFVKLLDSAGYNIYNLSIFDLAGHPALKKDRFLSASTFSMIFYSTLYNCIKRDLFWQIIPGYLEKANARRINERRDVLSPQKQYNRTIIDSLNHFIYKGYPAGPYFMYIHLKMPHFPYFNDSTGREYPEDTVFAEPMIRNLEKYRGYISYTNKVMDSLVSGMLVKNGGKDILIIQSDHGTDDFGKFKRENAFKNFTAYFFPDKDYRLLSNNMSNVNTFRVLLNKIFSQDLPILDSRTFYLK